MSTNMSTREVAAALGLSTRTVLDLIHKQEIPAYRIRRQWRVRRSDLEKWINSKREER